jgi:hypothetical protein
MNNVKNTARIFYCARCFKAVVICSYCDRGNIYCGSICSGQSRTVSHRMANQKYQHSLKGRLKHAKRQQRYRERKNITAKKVTDQGSPVLSPNDVLHDRPNEHQSRQVIAICCQFCDEHVSPFMRNGFLRHERCDVFSSWPLGP